MQYSDAKSTWDQQTPSTNLNRWTQPAATILMKAVIFSVCTFHIETFLPVQLDQYLTRNSTSQ